jgi:hypothetical protein
MWVDPENVKVIALIVGSMGTNQMSAIKDQNPEVRKVEKPKEGMEIKVKDCPTKRKGSNGGKKEDRDEANRASGYSDIALICNEELDSTFISLEEGEDRNEFKNLWVGDSRATCHIVCSDKNLINWKSVNEDVIVVGGGTLPVMKIGSLKVKFRNFQGEDSIVDFPKDKIRSKTQVKPLPHDFGNARMMESLII